MRRSKPIEADYLLASTEGMHSYKPHVLLLRRKKPSRRSALIECMRTFGCDVELNRLDIHPLLRPSRGSGAPPVRIG